MDYRIILGAYIPPLDSPKALKRIAEIKRKASKMETEKLQKHLDTCKKYVKENSRDGRAYLMIDANLVWSFSLQVKAVSEILKERN